MDNALLFANSLEWITNTILPILVVVIPVWIHLSSKHARAMDKKVDKDGFESKIKPIEESIVEVRSAQSEYAKTQLEILDKVTDIWKFLADKTK